MYIYIISVEEVEISWIIVEVIRGNKSDYGKRQKRFVVMIMDGMWCLAISMADKECDTIPYYQYPILSLSLYIYISFL